MTPMRQPVLQVQITAAVESVTPDMARAWRGGQAKNRNISWSRVHDYARDIKAGRWGLTGEPIIFDTHGKLIEGQHRCEAIIEADEGIYTLVVRGVDPVEFVRINTGKPRTMADALSIKGEPQATTLAGAMRLLYLWNHGAIEVPFPPRPTHDEMLLEVASYPNLYDSLQVRGWCRKVLTPSVTVFFHFLFARVDSELANTFMAKLGAGDDLSKDSPIYVLRELLLDARYKGERIFPVQQYALLIKAWNAFAKGRSVRRLTWSRQEPFPTVEGLG